MFHNTLLNLGECFCSLTGTFALGIQRLLRHLYDFNDGPFAIFRIYACGPYIRVVIFVNFLCFHCSSLDQDVPYRQAVAHTECDVLIIRMCIELWLLIKSYRITVLAHNTLHGGSSGMASFHLQPLSQFNFDTWLKWKWQCEQFCLASGLADQRDEKQVSMAKMQRYVNLSLISREEV